MGGGGHQNGMRDSVLTRAAEYCQIMVYNEINSMDPGQWLVDVKMMAMPNERPIRMASKGTNFAPGRTSLTV